MTGFVPARERLLALFALHESSGLRRIAIEIGGEQVTFSVRQGSLRESCSCGAPGCEHIESALRVLAIEGPSPVGAAELRLLGSQRPSFGPTGEVSALADALEELALATARTGIATPGSPSIKQALGQLTASAPKPLPLALSRWIGRFVEATEAGEAGEVARLLTGALGLSGLLRARTSSPEADELRRAWLGSAERPCPSLGDVTLVEVAREWLSGAERASIERRHWIDPASGACYVEERRRDEGDAISVGPCPRSAHVAFAELSPAARPVRVRLLQYAVSLQLSESTWTRLVELALPSVAALRERYAEDQQAAPGLAEPFVLFAPRESEARIFGSLRDARGESIELDSEQGAFGLAALLASTPGSDLVCVLGTLLGRRSGLRLRALSAIVRRGAWLELRRIR